MYWVEVVGWKVLTPYENRQRSGNVGRSPDIQLQTVFADGKGHVEEDRLHTEGAKGCSIPHACYYIQEYIEDTKSLIYLDKNI